MVYFPALHNCLGMFRWSCAPSIGLHSALRGKAHGPMDASLVKCKGSQITRILKRSTFLKNLGGSYTYSCFVLFLERWPLKSVKHANYHAVMLYSKYCIKILLFPPVLKLVFGFIFGIYWISSAFILSPQWAFMILIALLKLALTFIWWRKFCSQPIWSLLSPVTKLSTSISVSKLVIIFTGITTLLLTP